MKLRDAIILAASAAPRTTTLPILSCLAIKSDGHAITAIGSNLELGIEATAEFEAQPFEVSVDAEKFKQAITVMAEPKITVNGDRMLIKQGRSQATLPVMPYTDHPGMPDVSGADTTIDIDIWSMVESVAFAAAKNDVRFYLNGILVQSDGRQLVAAATDGHRMAVSRKDVELPVFNIIIPVRNLKALLTIRSRSISFGSCLVGRSNGVRIYSKLVDGKFPDWRRVVPDNQNRMTIATADLRRALQTVKPFSNEKYMGAHLEWKEGALTIRAKNEKQADSQVEIECQASIPSEIGVNIAYLEEAISTLQGERLEIQYQDSNRAIRIDEGAITHVVMPMRI